MNLDGGLFMGLAGKTKAADVGYRSACL